MDCEHFSPLPDCARKSERCGERLVLARWLSAALASSAAAAPLAGCKMHFGRSDKSSFRRHIILGERQFHLCMHDVAAAGAGAGRADAEKMSAIIASARMAART